MTNKGICLFVKRAVAIMPMDTFNYRTFLKLKMAVIHGIR